MPLPQLTKIGDSATLTVATCVPIETDDGPAVEFIFVGHEDEPMRRSRLGVDGAFLRMGFSFAPDRKDDDPVIDYAGAKGETLVFSRIKPSRGSVPGWRIEKAAKPEAQPQPATRAVAAPRDVADQLDAGADALTRKGTLDKEAQRQAVRDRYAAEFAWVLDTLVSLARKKKVVISFDVNASVGSLMIDFGKRGLI